MLDHKTNNFRLYLIQAQHGCGLQVNIVHHANNMEFNNFIVHYKVTHVKQLYMVYIY